MRFLFITCSTIFLLDFSAKAAEVTFTRDVAPILYARCTGCHHSGDIAPMPLVTYKETRPWAAAIRAAVITRKMPPWQADPHYGSFANDRRMADSEVAIVRAWVDQGAKEGDPKDLPPAPEFPAGWRAGTPDVVFAIPENHKVSANSPDEYVYLTVPTNFKEDVWVRSVELRPGNRKVVHHAHVYLKEAPKASGAKTAASGPKFTIEDGAVHHINPDMPVLDDGCSQPDGGYWPGRKPGETTTMLGSYLPGKEPDSFPEGYARKIPAGAVLEFQVHYHATKADEFDRTSVGFILAKEPPRQPLRRIDISNFLFRIPPGDPDHEVSACYTFPKDVEFMSYTAHMHLRGKDMKFEAVHPDGRRETLFSVPKYDFNWQNEYKLKEPVPIESGTRVIITAHFDNSTNNPANPDPTKAVRWGEPSYEEMMDGWIEYILPEDPAHSSTPAVAARAGGKR